jgi:beta-phosphoglucomutase-like phosphatase (HAD superfamily)
MTLAILDIDGTLVDTSYQHALAWYSAFREHGLSDATSDARMSV